MTITPSVLEQPFHYAKIPGEHTRKKKPQNKNQTNLT